MSNQVLKSLGLNDNEIVILSELLIIGTSVASTLSARTKINKSTIRYICQGLEKKGLIFSIQKDSTFLYTAESPRRLYSLIEEDKRKLKEKELNIGKSIAFLESLKNKKTVLPKVSFFQGIDGLEKLFEQILDYGEPIDSFEDSGQMVGVIPDFVDYFVDERIKRKIYNRVICPSVNSLNEDSKEDLRSVKRIDEKLFPFTGDIKICANHVSIMSFKENNYVAVSITDEDIANNFRTLFDYIWNQNK